MNKYLYLIRSGDLYKIGSTKNLDSYFKSLKPDEIIKTIQTSESKFLEAKLIRRYKSVRIPETGYFRLDQSQVDDCKGQLALQSKKIDDINSEFKIALSGSVLFCFSTFILLIFCHIDFSLSLVIALIVGSIPMWLIFIAGNFGGYYSKDLPRFATFFTRIK